LRIGIIARTWFTSTKGGSELYIKRIFEELKKSHRVVVVTLDIDPDPDVIQIRLPRIPFFTQVLFSLLASVRINSIKPDVCVVNQYWAEFSPLLLRVPWVSIVHDVGLFYSERAKRNLIKHIFRVKILSLVTKKSKKIIAPSKLTMNDLHKYIKVPLEKIRIVNEGVDLEDPAPPIQHDGINILCVARVAPNKGHDILLKAFRTIRGKYRAKLYLVGGISKDNRKYFQSLKEYIEKFDVKDVVFTDRVSDEKLKTYYRMADIYVQPSTGEEGWGITITEAYRYRLPVVCTRIFAKTGVADEDRAIVVKEGDPDQLAKAIETLIEDNATRERISERGNIFAKDLSWEKMSREILQIIEETRRSNHPNNR